MHLDRMRTDELVRQYQQLHWYVAWEGGGGWCNMAAEALACGVQVVTNGNNCEPFLDRCYETDDLRKFFLDRRETLSMSSWDWDHTVDLFLGVTAPEEKRHADKQALLG